MSFVADRFLRKQSLKRSKYFVYLRVFKQRLHENTAQQSHLSLLKSLLNINRLMQFNCTRRSFDVN